MASLDFNTTHFTADRQADGRQEIDIKAGSIVAADVSTGTPGSSAVGDTAGAGSATSLARSDHRHGREAFGSPAATGIAASDGAATTVARSNHVHTIGAVPTARVSKSGTQAIPDSAWTVLTFDTETYDTDTIFSVGVDNTVLQAARAGTYLVFGMVLFAASAGGTIRAVRLYKNGVAGQLAGHGGINATVQPAIVVMDVIALAAGDDMQLYCLQNSGGNLNVDVTTSFGMYRIGD